MVHMYYANTILYTSINMLQTYMSQTAIRKSALAPNIKMPGCITSHLCCCSTYFETPSTSKNAITEFNKMCKWIPVSRMINYDLLEPHSVISRLYNCKHRQINNS